MIETKGYVGALEAGDAMVKAARVEIIGRMEVGSGYVAILVQGEVGAVKAAVGAGLAAAQKIGTVIAHHIIPRPHYELAILLDHLKHSSPNGNTYHDFATRGPRKKLDDMTVVELRALARETKNIEIKGRDISMATKEDLIQVLKKIYNE